MGSAESGAAALTPGERIGISSDVLRLVRERQALRVTDAPSAIRSARIAAQILELVRRLDAAAAGPQSPGVAALQYLVDVAGGRLDGRPLTELLASIRASVATVAQADDPDPVAAGHADRAVSHWASLEAAAP